jgi:diguanylate cyclase (GGDEF)-like protein
MTLENQLKPSVPPEAALSSSPPPPVLDTMPPPGTERGRGTLLMLQSSAQREQLFAAALAGEAVEFLLAESAEDVERQVMLRAPDVLILDRSCPEWAAVCRAFKAGPVYSMPLVIVDWDGGGEEAAVEALDAGADEYVGEPGRVHELRARINNQLRHKRRLDTLQRLRAERDSLRFDAALDSLTSVLSRKALDRALSKLDHDDSAFSLVFLDVDLFKTINDGFGHAVGDRVLAALGRLLRDHVRPNDIVGRYGGEEFVVVLREAGSDAARRVADRIRQSISGCTIAGLPRRVTVSAGVATRAQGEPMGELIARADLALYAAKSAGRNRVLLAPPAAAVLEESFASMAPPDTRVRATSRSQELVGQSAAE